MEQQALRVFICEDSEVVRTGITRALEQAGGVTICGYAANGAAAVISVCVAQPDVVLMDVMMPGMDGITATKQIKARCPKVKILMLTALDDESTTLAALGSGADGYCLKQSSIRNTKDAILSVSSGACWLDPAIAAFVLRHCAREAAACSGQKLARRGGIDDRFRLSPREIDVLELLVKGHTNKQIADTLIIGLETVKTHMARIMEKLQVADRTQAAVKALREGLVAENHF